MIVINTRSLEIREIYRRRKLLNLKIGASKLPGNFYFTNQGGTEPAYPPPVYASDKVKLYRTGGCLTQLETSLTRTSLGSKVAGWPLQFIR